MNRKEELRKLLDFGNEDTSTGYVGVNDNDIIDWVKINKELLERLKTEDPDEVFPDFCCRSGNGLTSPRDYRYYNIGIDINGKTYYNYLFYKDYDWFFGLPVWGVNGTGPCYECDVVCIKNERGLWELWEIDTTTGKNSKRIHNHLKIVDVEGVEKGGILCYITTEDGKEYEVDSDGDLTLLTEDEY